MYSREKRSKDEWKNVGKMKVMCVWGERAQKCYESENR